MAKATPKKVMTPKAASNDKSPKILGAQKQKTPKSAVKAPKPSTPQVMQMAAVIKKRKSVATSFQVSDIAEEKTPKKTDATPAKTPKTPLTGKRQKQPVQTPDVESEQPKKKKKQSMAADAVETPIKSKKKSLVAQSETPAALTPNEKKKKKLSVAAATASKPFKVEKKMKPATEAPVAEAESAAGDEPKKKKKKRGKKSKSGGADKGATPKVDTDEGASPSKKVKLDADQIQLKTGKGKNQKQERSVYTLYVGNLSFNITADILRDHFTKAGLVPGRIHLPLTKETNMPRGFAYVDLPDNEQYIKGLKLHNTFIGKRHIRVEFTMPGKKKAPNRMKAIKSKDLKLKAMQRRGILQPKVKPTMSEIVARSEV